MNLEERKDIRKITGIMCRACWEISGKIRKCNPTEMAHMIGIDNISGDHIKFLDDYAQNVIVNSLNKCELVHGIISEEHDEMYSFDNAGKYVVAFDPIDGSSNIEFNITTGTIFGIYRLTDGKIESGRNIVAAGYCLYGGVTEFIYTDAHDDKVKVMRLDIDNYKSTTVIDDLRIPKKGKYYSINQAYSKKWLDSKIATTVEKLADSGFSLRYVGSMVADMHRVVMNGGIFMYPADSKNKNGKIRFYYEACPFAFIIEKIGGVATNFTNNILDLKAPERIHAAIPVVLGSEYEMDIIKS